MMRLRPFLLISASTVTRRNAGVSATAKCVGLRGFPAGGSDETRSLSTPFSTDQSDGFSTSHRCPNTSRVSPPISAGAKRAARSTAFIDADFTTPARYRDQESLRQEVHLHEL